ncbi:hypothetical protein DV872_02255 [Oceanispirochaeta sp. M1]|nr:hypothetical protein DV872_02255 [Oceanispirochaeta sp. M1]
MFSFFCITIISRRRKASASASALVPHLFFLPDFISIIYNKFQTADDFSVFITKSIAVYFIGID